MGLNTFPCNPYPISTEELNKGNNDELNIRVTTLEEGVTGLGNRVTTLEGGVTNLNSNKANQITIAPFFNAETAYEVGDLVYYNGLSYRCTNAHEGEWDADDFAGTTIANELSTLKSGLINYVKIDYARLAADTTLQAGFIDVQFTPPTIEGYKPIGVVAYNLGDRALGASVHISGIDMRQSVAHIYGSVSQEVTITTSAYVSILYIRDI